MTIKCLMGSRDEALDDILKGHDEEDHAFEKTLDYLKKERRIPENLTFDMFRHCVETIVQRGAAFSNYHPASNIDTDICLYRARETDKTQGIEEQSWNWTEFTGGSFVRHWMPGDHFTMIKGDNASALAEKIQGHIRNADKA